MAFWPSQPSIHHSPFTIHHSPFTIFPVAFRALRGFIETARNGGNRHEFEPKRAARARREQNRRISLLGDYQWPK
jgi:hypothetical protein